MSQLINNYENESDLSFVDEVLNLESTLWRVRCSSEPFKYLALKNVLYASKRFSYMCSVLQMSPSQYFSLWCDFYKYLDLQKYSNHYSMMESDDYYRSSWLIHRNYLGGFVGISSECFPTNVVEFACDDECFQRFKSSQFQAHHDLIKHRSIGDRYKFLYQ